MNKKWLKSTLCALLVVPMLGMGAPAPVPADAGAAAQHTAAQPAQGDAAYGAKEEVVYASLAANGAVQGQYVVNGFEVAAAGQLVDYGDYTSVANLTSTLPIAQQGDAVRAEVEAGNFYYQGNMEGKPLPWQLDIRYYLDGAEVDPQALSGQSGRLEIRIETRPSPEVDPVFYDNYMLQISLTLDTEKCSDIASEGATIAASGKSKVISHTVMPGKDADISITATVENFSMGGVEVAGMPFSMSFDIPDTGEMLGEMTTLSDAIDELNTGAGTLASGVRELEDGTAQLVSGSAGFSDGLAALAAGGPQLTDGSAQIDEALAAMAAGLKGTGQGGIDLGELGQLPATLRQLSQGLQAMSAGIVELKTSYDGMLAGLDALIAGIPALSQEENEAIGMLLASLPDDAAKANLAAVYTAALTLQGGYTTPGPEGASLQQGLAAVSTALDVMANGDAQDAANTGLNGMVAALNAMADGIESALQNMDFGEQLGQLASGLSKLSKEYGQFHIGLVEYTGGVQQLAGGYGALHGGLAGLHEGTAELASGTQKLHNGTTELNDAVADLPDTMQLEIDKLLADYEFDDFTPVSFTSPKNTQVALVQFVLMTEGIVLEEEAGTAAEEGNTQSIWDRFLALFNTDKE